MKLLRNLITILIALAMVGIGILFALQNKTPVALDLLVYTFAPQSLALWILGAFALGGLLGLLASSAMLLKTRTALGASRRQLDRTRTELEELREDTRVAGSP